MMEIDLKHGTSSDRGLFHQLMQLYLYDFSEFLPLFIDNHGFFEQTILDDYFTNPAKDPFLITVDSRVAGFILVNAEPILEQNRPGKRLKEFFIMRRFRRSGVGQQSAIQVFDLFPGQWEVGVIQKNIPAQHFWEATIKKYSGGAYSKEVRNDEIWSGPIFSLITGRNAQ